MRATHAGAVAFRETGTGREYLVISSSSGSDWVLPKGHIEKAETASEAALRELMEESGVAGRIVGQLKPVTFKTKAEEVRVSFLLVRSTGKDHFPKKRTVEWLRYPEARGKLSFEEARSVLDEAERILQDRSRKIAFMTAELENLIAFFGKESSRHKCWYRWLRYPSIFLTACEGALATLALTFHNSQETCNLIIVFISGILAILVAIEALRIPRDLWIHERQTHNALRDLLRELDYRSLESACSEQVLDAMFDQLQSILGNSGAKWQEFLHKQEKLQNDKKPAD